MRNVTLVFVLDADRILLGRKLTGLGKGLYNGFGGKVESGESIQDAARRELFEECSLTADVLEKVAVIDFYFSNKPQWNQRGHIYLCRHFTGTPSPSVEMVPEWFSIDDIPYDKMWEGDRLWIPKLLDGDKLSATMVFASDNESVKEYTDTIMLE